MITRMRVERGRENSSAPIVDKPMFTMPLPVGPCFSPGLYDRPVPLTDNVPGLNEKTASHEVDFEVSAMPSIP